MGLLHGQGSHHCIEAAFQGLLDDRPTAQATAQLEPHIRKEPREQAEVRLERKAESTVQIHQVDACGTSIYQLRDPFFGLQLVVGDLIKIAMQQAHHSTAQQIEGWDELDHFSSSGVSPNQRRE